MISEFLLRLTARRAVSRAHVRWGFLLCLMGGLVSGSAAAQAPAPSDTIYEVRLADGSSFIGRVVNETPDLITIETQAGVRLEVRREQIRTMRAARGRIVGGQFWRDDPNTSRLFFAPTGRSISAGDGYFGVYELFIPFLSYGVTDAVTISGGSPFYLGMFDSAPPVYFAPKVRVFSGSGSAVSVGTLFVWLPSEWNEDNQTFGILYGVGTFGSADNAATAGLGWGYVGSDFSSRPAAMVGGEARVGRMTKLISENWFVPGEDGVILSGGVRFFGERLSADAGLIGFISGDETACCLPLVNFLYHFGRSR
jgi:hypothetical protein